MEKRKIGKLDVSIVGVCCNQFGVTVDGKGTREVVDAAIEHGVTLFDTADEYGLGQSETLLGQTLRGRRDKAGATGAA